MIIKMEKAHIFYHITSKENLNSIFKNGLKCSYGPHCKYFQDQGNQKLIYLTKRKDIPTWLGTFVDGTVVLEVDTTGYIIKRKYINTWRGKIWEYGCFNNIPPNRLKIVYNEDNVINKRQKKREECRNKGRFY